MRNSYPLRGPVSVRKLSPRGTSPPGPDRLSLTEPPQNQQSTSSLSQHADGLPLTPSSTKSPGRGTTRQTSASSMSSGGAEGLDLATHLRELVELCNNGEPDQRDLAKAAGGLLAEISLPSPSASPSSPMLQEQP
jgi:hypothetical protein